MLPLEIVHGRSVARSYDAQLARALAALTVGLFIHPRLSGATLASEIVRQAGILYRPELLGDK
jgi:hypothetical protein